MSNNEEFGSTTVTNNPTMNSKSSNEADKDWLDHVIWDLTETEDTQVKICFFSFRRVKFQYFSAATNKFKHKH